MSSVGGWSCQRCTFYHHAPSARCAMCNELRISKKQMTDFIQGIPIDDGSSSRPPKIKKNNKESAARSGDHVVDDEQQPNQEHSTKRQQQPADTTTAAKPPARGGTMSVRSQQPNGVKRSSVSNPYAKQSPALKIPPYAGPPPPLQPNRPRSDPHPDSSFTDNSHAQSATTSDNVEHITVPQHERLVSHPSEQNQGDMQQQSAQGTNGKQRGPEKTSPLPAQRKTPPQQQQPHPLQHNSPIAYKPGPVPLDEECAGEWIFPKDERYPRRQYQFEIARTAILHNTLVGLPTGLGKTLIAAVVMYNYYRWFPTGKVVFMAPTLPLVYQQVKACYEIMGIPERDTAILTGKMLPARRALVWAERRAFFCTPQTMQKDIEQTRVDPNLVVLVVLDEAHKARGEYAYNKIIRQLDQCAAQYRVLGLSATPGSQIKIIQEVVTSLHISRVECRSEEDPDVKQYIHDRQTEIVLVQQQSACRQIELLINDMLEPELSKLRRAQALPYNGNSTLTAWLIIRARNEYVDRTKDYTYNGIFEAVRTFVELRTLLHQHGVSTVRAKLIKLRDDKKRGMDHIIRSDRFQKLMDLIYKSSCDPNSKLSSVEMKVMNNPKLQKLQEILLEHFERARVKGESSRSIVFSQYRDSVGEIVNVLNASRPMLRPRHFVGQGKGPSLTNGSCVFKGMSQTEQQQVIKQFRDDVYNVLVCTCIGEEGLDIGEVDLIVNFDSLLSPVRMLQRVGRTGRKRDGRVVFLIAEGAEERTYRGSKIKEQNIVRAMKRPDAFTVAASVPLLPMTPEVCERNMINVQNFHMSQVEGLGEAKRQARSIKPWRPSDSKSWRLSDDSEARRAAVLGDSNNVKTRGDEAVTSAVRQRILVARLYLTESFQKKTLSRLGRVSNLLREFESGSSSRKHRKPARRRIRHSEIDAWFPLTSSDEGFEVLAWGKPHQRHKGGSLETGNLTEKRCLENNASEPLSCPIATHSVALACEANDQNTSREISNNIAKNAAVPPAQSKGFMTAKHPVGDPLAKGSCDLKFGKKTNYKGGDLKQSNRKNSTKTTIKTSGDPRPKHSSAQNNLKKTKETGVDPPSKHSSEQKAPKTLETRVPQPMRRMEQKKLIDNPVPNQFIHERETSGQREDTRTNETVGPPDNDGFKLPTQSSSSDDDDSDESDDSDVDLEALIAGGNNDSTTLNTSEGDVIAGNQKARDCLKDNVFTLPSQDSSSSEDGSDDESGLTQPQHQNGRAESLFFAEKKNATETLQNALDIDGTSESDKKIPQGNGLRNNFDKRHFEDENSNTIGGQGTRLKQKRATEPNRSQLVEEDSDTIIAKIQQNKQMRKKRKVVLDDDEDDDGSPAFKAAAKLDTAIEDSSSDSSVEMKESHGRLKRIGHSAKPLPVKAHETKGRQRCVKYDITGVDGPLKCHEEVTIEIASDDGLVDTPVPADGGTADDIVCAVCGSGESPDEDPIFLCDGPGHGIECDLAVHATCYSVTIENADDEWRCDPCAHRFDGGSENLHCIVCAADKGPLKRLSRGQWTHTFCKPAAATSLSKGPQPEKIIKTSKAKERKRHYRHFLDEEASMDSEEDMDGDEEEEKDILNIEEEEELHSSFINDSSQLGFSAGTPDGIEDDNDDVHRAVDMEEAQRNALKTPILNRRMRRNRRSSNSQRLSDISCNTAGSEGGLGNMHFIRSVLEHHRQGGTAEEIEQAYQEMEAEDNNEDEPILPEKTSPKRTVLEYKEEDSDDDWPA